LSEVAEPVEVDPVTGSIRLARPGSLPGASAPAMARPLSRALATLEHGLDRLYGSRWNPLDQSGSLAVALMLVVIVTGVYLLIVYRIGAPWESMQRIQSEAWAGRWLRALHRYASDATVVFVALHGLRMLARGRTWGPRVLAWVTGLLLTATVLVVGWTGYILVWDDHARMLGAAGARLMDSLGILPTPIGRIFDGGAMAPASFFFLNLFVHMSLPLGMAILLWIHTLRLARSRWLPDRTLWIAATLALLAVSLVWPATLGPHADGLTLGDRAAYDLFYTAWVPFAQRLPAGASWAIALGLALVPLTIPAWWRPARDRKPEPSRHNAQACTGCGQCVQDCPFEAIAMGPNPRGPGLHEIAMVNPARCVSCGLCAGSCDQLAIGPPSRDGHAQVRLVKRLDVPAETGPALVYCASDGAGERLAARARAGGHAVTALAVECAGNVHALTVSQLGARFGGVYVLACPAHRCRSREGVELSRARLLEGHEPKLRQALDPARVRWASGSVADLSALEEEFAAFRDSLAGRAAGATTIPRRGELRSAPAVALTLAAVAVIAWLSQMPAGATPAHAALRLAWRLPGQSIRDCRPLSAEEIARQPAHMRVLEDCRTVYLDYDLKVWVDGEKRLETAIAPRGARGDRPLYVDHDLALTPGRHVIRAEFVPQDDPGGKAMRLEFEGEATFEPGRAVILTRSPEAIVLKLDPGTTPTSR
jgi:menaquinol-cytochrome c reductase cytochrome b subunit